MRTSLKPQYYYHVTRSNWAPIQIVCPRFNYSYHNEPNTPRICVGPSVTHCFAALPLRRKTEYILYRTANKVRAVYPINVHDSGLTREMWLLKPTKFIQICKIRSIVSTLIDDLAYDVFQNFINMDDDDIYVDDITYFFGIHQILVNYGVEEKRHYSMDSLKTEYFQRRIYPARRQIKP